MSLAAKIESNVYDESYHASENLALGDSQISIHKISDKSALSAVSGAAIIAGATVAVALALLLLLLGTSLGLSTVLPWANQNISAISFGLTAILSKIRLAQLLPIPIIVLIALF